MKKIGLSTDCVCDLPESYFEKHEVSVVYFYVKTETGQFRDVYEVTAGNITEYLSEQKKKIETMPPEPEEFVEHFTQELKKYESIIHIAISANASHAYENAVRAVEMMGEEGKRVHIFDSMHVSTGMGHIVIKAEEMRNQGKDIAEILKELDSFKRKVSTSFISPNADYLYYNGKVSKGVRNLCAWFHVHPVLKMKNGKITLASIRVGKYHKAVLRYIRHQLKHANKIDRKRLFITHTGCPVRFISRVKDEVVRNCSFESVIVTKASATISGNCGVETIGVLFVNES